MKKTKMDLENAQAKLDECSSCFMCFNTGAIITSVLMYINNY